MGATAMASRTKPAPVRYSLSGFVEASPKSTVREPLVPVMNGG